MDTAEPILKEVVVKLEDDIETLTIVLRENEDVVVIRKGDTVTISITPANALH